MNFKFKWRHLGMAIAGIILAILLPTPLLLLVAGGWLGLKGAKKVIKPDDKDEHPDQ